MHERTAWFTSLKVTGLVSRAFVLTVELRHHFSNKNWWPHDPGLVCAFANGQLGVTSNGTERGRKEGPIWLAGETYVKMRKSMAVW